MNASSGFHSPHWEFLFRPWIGKTHPISNDRLCKVTLQCPPLGSARPAVLKLNSAHLEESNSQADKRKGWRKLLALHLPHQLFSSTLPRMSTMSFLCCGVCHWDCGACRSEVSKLEPMSQIQPTHCFGKGSFIGTHFIRLCTVYGYFQTVIPGLSPWNWDCTVCKLKIFTIRIFTGKVCW